MGGYYQIGRVSACHRDVGRLVWIQRSIMRGTNRPIIIVAENEWHPKQLAFMLSKPDAGRQSIP
jgi:hypothetical protein